MRECPRKAEDAHCGMDYAYLKQSFVLHCIQPRSGKLTAAHCSSAPAQATSTRSGFHPHPSHPSHPSHTVAGPMSPTTKPGSCLP